MRSSTEIYIQEGAVKDFFKGLKVKLINIKDKLLKHDNATHSSGAKDESVDESSLLELSLFGPKYTYKQVTDTVDYLKNSVVINFTRAFEIMECAIKYANQVVEKTDEAECKNILNQAIKESNDIYAKYKPKVNNTRDTSILFNNMLRNGCKGVIKSLSQEELEKLANYLDKTIKELDNIYKSANNDMFRTGKKNEATYDRYNKIKKKSDSLTEGLTTCVTIMSYIYSEFGYKEYDATMQDYRYNASNFSYLYKNCK